MRILARAPADGDELERAHVHAPRTLRREIVCQTQTLARRLAREGEAQPLRALVFVIDDQIITGRLTWEVTIDDLRCEQTLALSTLFQFIENWSHLLRDERAILLRRASPLLELPLTFEQRRFVDESEDFSERNASDDARAVERRVRDGHVGAYIGAARVRRVARGVEHTARAREATAHAVLGLFADQIFSFAGRTAVAVCARRLRFRLLRRSLFTRAA